MPNGNPLLKNNDTQIPAVGIGTFLMSPRDAEEAVYQAFPSGDTMADTANAYLNEKAVGRGLKRACVRREEITVSAKLWPSAYSKATAGIDETLQRLGTDSIDLLFLHQPVGGTDAARRAMEDAVRAGKVRSLGLSNFPIEEIRRILEHSSVKPSVVRAEAHPCFPQTELRRYLKTIGAVIMARYPLGHGGRSLGNEPVFTKLAARYRKSNAQIILRRHVQMGNIVIPGSRNPQHIRDSIDLFDFALTDAEMAKIAAVDKNRRYCTVTKEALEGYASFAPDFNAQD